MSELSDLLSQWLKRVEVSCPPIAEIRAYNFGIFETPDGYSVYLIGSRTYDMDDDDWACVEDYSPLERYLKLPEDLSDGINWQDIQDRLKTTLEVVILEIGFLDRAEYVTTGFDGGLLLPIKALLDNRP